MKRRLKRVLSYIKHHRALEGLFLNLMIVFGTFLSIYGYRLATLIFVGIVLYKLVQGNLLESLFTAKLFMGQNDNRMYSVFGVVNIFMFTVVIFSDYHFFSAYLTLIAFRSVLKLQELYVQNFLLHSAVEELYEFQEDVAIDPLASEQTELTLRRLAGIRDEVQKSVVQSMETERLKTELITNISHDLKTPLTSIISYSDILSKKDVMDDEAKEYIAVLGRNSERLKALIVDLIYASKTGSGAIQVEKLFIDFNELVSQIYGDFDELFNERGLDFDFVYDNDDINLYTDPGIVSRIISNLISNCYKYATPHTTIHAKVTTFETHILFTLSNETSMAFDGNEDDLINELVKSEKSRNTEGSGLGLYITRNLADLLGGAFHIVFRGGRFEAKLTLPREE
ncbi:HAMP domain-containing sensor histidine kinase [Peptoniphilus equinus]|uniref:histidine kinase n=1 Tax=Peptoniphilus equinus TaxID=3016343 RepID=A0ABY7QTP4_9FIRM|nr:HAMP domain-containing sensor histidine kinase [Peptoniphilus equinus]WBW50147.1 HAMP domain-containing sensor histidine kinase [Peptoniphilus equinus]